VLEKWGPGCHFFGHGPDSDIVELEAFLASSSDVPPFSALFCEFPSNPRLQAPRLDRLRALADRHDFLIVLDDTVGNFANVDVLPYVDILATSLSKFFSGSANVLGGRCASSSFVLLEN
jgi:cystathionine gamma-synthase